MYFEVDDGGVGRTHPTLFHVLVVSLYYPNRVSSTEELFARVEVPFTVLCLGGCEVLEEVLQLFHSILVFEGSIEECSQVVGVGYYLEDRRNGIEHVHQRYSRHDHDEWGSPFHLGYDEDYECGYEGEHEGVQDDGIRSGGEGNSRYECDGGTESCTCISVVYESARLLWSMLCMTHPPMVNPAPVNTPISALGRRPSQMK